MNDIETSVFSPIATTLRTEYPGVSVTGEYVREPSKFPHVSIVESDNYVSTNRRDTASRERYSTVMYEVNVYSDLQSGKKAECRKILNTIDEMMYGMNFTRIAMTPVPNMQNSSVYRLTARYRAETDGTNLYRF